MTDIEPYEPSKGTITTYPLKGESKIVNKNIDWKNLPAMERQETEYFLEPN